MSLDSVAILNKLKSHALASGLFERVNTHEPKNAPGNGMTAVIYLQEISPITRSGLASTSARVAFNVRILVSMLQEPQDAIDTNVAHAVDVLFDAYSGDFELGGSVRNIDLLGMTGTGLSMQAGYITIDSKMFRIADITVPLIVNDVWEQVP